MQEKRPTVGIQLISDGIITGADFLEAANNLLRLATEVDLAFSQAARTVDWALKRLSYASPAVLEFEPITRDGQPDNRMDIADAVIAGIESLKVTPERPRYFTDQALTSARALVGILGQRITRIIIFSSDVRVVECEETIAKNVRTILRPGREMLGSVDGYLQAMDSHAGFRFALFEPVFSRRIEGRLDENAPDNLKDEIVRLFERRVRISGILRTNVRGEATGVKAQAIIPLRTAASFRSSDEVAALFDITDGMSAEDYVRSLRDA